MYGTRQTNIDYSQSALREEYGKFVVLHGRQRGEAFGSKSTSPTPMGSKASAGI